MRKYVTHLDYCAACGRRIPADRPGPRTSTQFLPDSTIEAIRSMRLTGTSIKAICSALHVGPETVIKYAPTPKYARKKQLQAVKQQIADGTYETEEKLGKAALRSVPDLLKEISKIHLHIP